MTRLSASILAIGLAATSGLASAQSYGSYGGYNDDPAHRNPNAVQPVGGGYYDYARVVRVDPVMGSGYGSYPSSQRCYSESSRDGGYAQNGYYDQYGNYHANGYGNTQQGNGYYDQYGNYHPATGGSNTGRTVATVIGGIAGAVLGSKVGGGSGQVAASAIGGMVGGMAGRQVYDSSHRPQRTATVQVCDPVPANGYYGNANNNVATSYDVTYEYAGRQYTTRTSYNPGDRIRVRVDVRPE